MVTDSAAMDPETLARACVDRMWASDSASRSLGMVMENVAPGSARVSMRVRDDMVNGHDICHGGIISTLADSAFAFACNTGGTVTVAAGFTIDFLAPARLGDELIAQADQLSLAGRSGLYDVTVSCGEVVVAQFRGRSRSLGRPLLD